MRLTGHELCWDPSVLILNFHRIESPTGLEITRITPARFCRFLEMIEHSGLTAARPGCDPLSVGNQVVLTFDDGFSSVARNALPELRRRGWGAVVFLIAASIGTTDDWDVRLLGRRRMMMNWDDIYEWSAAGIEFGSHTMTHSDLTALSDSALTAELGDSKGMLENKLGNPVRFLSYPFGRHDARVRQAAREAGYDAAFATGGTIWDHGDRYAISRINVSALTSLFEFRTILRAAANSGRGEGQMRPRWRNRLFESLNAGSAAVGNWRRARKSRPGTKDYMYPINNPSCNTDNRNATGPAGLR